MSCCVRRYVDDVISRIGRMFPDMTIELFRPNGSSAVLLVSTHACTKCQRNPNVSSGPFRKRRVEVWPPRLKVESNFLLLSARRSDDPGLYFKHTEMKKKE